MTRLPDLPLEAMTPEQRRVHDAIMAGPRGSVQGPFLAWMRNPELADSGQRLGEYFRFRTSLSRAQAELAICLTAVHYKAEFEWWAHAQMAHDAGVPEHVTEAIRVGREPAHESDKARTVWRTTRALNERHRLNDAEFAEAREILGEQGLVDVIGLCGYYALVSLTLNTFQVPVPDGGRPFGG